MAASGNPVATAKVKNKHVILEYCYVKCFNILRRVKQRISFHFCDWLTKLYLLWKK